MEYDMTEIAFPLVLCCAMLFCALYSVLCWAALQYWADSGGGCL